MHRQR